MGSPPQAIVSKSSKESSSPLEDFKLSIRLFPFEELVHLSVKILSLRIWKIVQKVHDVAVIVANTEDHLRGRHAGKRGRVSATPAMRDYVAGTYLVKVLLS